jgi:hypothetical protein
MNSHNNDVDINEAAGSKRRKEICYPSFSFTKQFSFDI